MQENIRIRQSAAKALSYYIWARFNDYLKRVGLKKLETGKSKLKNITKEELISLLDSGYTNEQLANYFECSITTIKARKKYFNLVGYKTNSKPLTIKEIQELESLANKGVGFVKACASIGKAPQTVRKYIPKNIQMRLVTNGNINLKEAHRKATFEKLLQPTKQTAYIIGYLVADGNISKEGAISAVSKDIELIQFCCDYFGSNLNIINKPDGRLFYTFTAKDHRYLEKVKKTTNLIPNKTYSCYTIPEWIKNSQEFMGYFVTGLFNGDGSVSKVAGRNTVQVEIELHINQYSFLDQVNSFLGWNIYRREGKARISSKKKSTVESFAKMFCYNPYSMSRKSEILIRYSLSTTEK